MLLYKINVKDGQCFTKDLEGIKNPVLKIGDLELNYEKAKDRYWIGNTKTGKESGPFFSISSAKKQMEHMSSTKDGALSDLFGGLADGLLEVTEKEARDSKTTKDDAESDYKKEVAQIKSDYENRLAKAKTDKEKKEEKELWQYRMDIALNKFKSKSNAKDSKTKDANFLANTNDPEERKKQKEFLKNYFGSEYSPVRHDAFVIRYNKEQEEKNQKEYRKNRNIDSSPDWYDDLGLDEDTKAIIDLFCSKKKIKDHEDLHELAEELGMEPSSLEEKVYALLQSFFSEGRYMSSDVGNIDSKELKMGDEVELEHTKSPIIARRIALDHLAELPDYYTKLAKMEKK